MFKLDLYIGLGGNKGNIFKNIDEGLKILSGLLGGVIKKQSSYYKTEPWGKLNQKAFINKAAILSVLFDDPNNLSIVEIGEYLLRTCLKVEGRFGRIRTETWGPRTLDIDLLFLSNYVIDTPNLTIPHPWVQDRRFVLEPLREIAANFIHPVSNKTIQELVKDCADKGAVRKLAL